MIDGNISATFQMKSSKQKNPIGEVEHIWSDVLTTIGFLDLSTQSTKYTTYNAKIEESTHIFICDYKPITFTSENSRVIINNQMYQITFIDDPMGLHQHLEFYLKYVGGQNG